MKHLSETEQWLIDQARASIFMPQSPPDPTLEEVRRFTKAYWPFMESYYSPLQPCFSFELRGAEKQKLRMLRDGAIPLAWFFESSSPANFSGLLVHASLGGLVPREWRKTTKFYEIYANQCFHAAAPPKNLFLFGPVNPGIVSLEEADILLDEAQEALGKSKIEKVLAYCPVRMNDFTAGKEESFEFQLYHRIFTRFGSQVQFLSWQMIEHANFADTAVMDFNGGWIYKDNSVVHLALSRGAGLLRAPKKEERAVDRVPLSKFHGIEVSASSVPGAFRALDGKEDLVAFYSALHRKANEPRNRVPWPIWFQGAFRARQGNA